MFLPSYLLGCLLFHCDFFTPMAEKTSLVDFMVPAIADLPKKLTFWGGQKEGKFYVESVKLYEMKSQK